MTRRSILACLVALTGCEDTLSADPFVTDEEFLEALPHSEDHTLTVAESTSATRGVPPPDTDDGWPDLYVLSLDVARTLNGFTMVCLNMVDAVAAYPPTYRSADGRQWGPVDVEDDVTFTLNMAREPHAYTWDFRAATTGTDDLPSLCAGTHDPGSEALAEGTGAIDIWLDNWDDSGIVGTLATQYDLSDGQELRIDIEGVGEAGARTEDGAYYFRRTRGSGGDFQYRTTILLDGVEAILEVRTRWVAGGAGRADARILSDDYPRDYRFSECFAAGGDKVWLWTDLSTGYEEGRADACVFDRPAAVDQI